ncbi:hypothetical protein [Anabaena sp. CCY 9402-a]|uniref:hypothetical protein n=1 Tax=Anabaena sp. CCY 9402-a TaxID=3103867 RepID=UPI0039C5E325
MYSRPNKTFKKSTADSSTTNPFAPPRMVVQPLVEAAAPDLQSSDAQAKQVASSFPDISRFTYKPDPSSPPPIQMQIVNQPGEQNEQAANHVNSFTVSQTGGEVLQRAYELCSQTDVTPKQDHRAKEVYVQNIQGTPLGAAANSPTAAGNPFGWTELHAAGHTLANTGSNNSHYNAVRMHLWNGRLGGPGNESWNLAPGPAKVNSMMSAGPETSAKNLVEAGESIWLKTNVSYLNNSTNANDFTSVVPNRIDMAWGVMGNTASGTWGTDIQLPVAPLQGQAAQEYKDWPQNQAADLVNKLNQTGITDQIRAQAFDLVQYDELKWSIIHNFPQIYLGMEEKTKGAIIKAMPSTVLDDFMKNSLKVITSAELFVQEIILPLVAVSESIKAQTLFSTLLNQTEQRKGIIAYKWDLLQHLGAIAESFAKTDWTIFNYLPNAAKANLLSQLEQNNQINTFLSNLTNKPKRKELFDLWANEAGKGGSPQQKFDFIDSKTNLDAQYKDEYESTTNLEAKALEYMQGRSKRSKKPIFKPKKEDKNKTSGGVKKRTPKKVTIKSKTK